MKGELASFVSFFRDGLAQADPATVEKAAIPVEKIGGPILLISGTDDQIWPAGEFCAAILARLKKAGFPHEVKHLSIEKGGHMLLHPLSDHGQSRPAHRRRSQRRIAPGGRQGRLPVLGRDHRFSPPPPGPLTERSGANGSCLAFWWRDGRIVSPDPISPPELSTSCPP